VTVKQERLNTALSSQTEAHSKAPAASLSRLSYILTHAEKLLLLICFDSFLLF